MEDILQTQNLGVIIKVNETDFQVGSENSLVYESVCADWQQFRPSDQWQAGKYGDKLNCVTHGLNNSVGTQLNFQITNNLLPQTHIDFLKKNGYIDQHGKVDFNERVSAILNGTTENGNDFVTVINSARKYGLFPASILPDDHGLSWEEFYDRSKITDAMLAVGLQFKALFELPYEWVIAGATEMNQNVIEKVKYHLAHAPLLIAAPWCPGFGAGVKVAACESLRPQHATIILKDDAEITIFDHYDPFVKTLVANYPIPYVLKPVIRPKQGILQANFGDLLKQNGKPAIYFYGLDGFWHGLGNMEVLKVFKGVYDPAKTIRVDTLPQNISFTITK